MKTMMHAMILVVLLTWLSGTATAETVELMRVLDCGPRTLAECADAVLSALGHGPGFKLKADTPTDTVHGAVTIEWCEPMPCAVTIRMEMYEQDDPPKARRQSHLKQSAMRPSKQEIRGRVDRMILP